MQNDSVAFREWKSTVERNKKFVDFGSFEGNVALRYKTMHCNVWLSKAVGSFLGDFHESDPSPSPVDVSQMKCKVQALYIVQMLNEMLHKKKDLESIS